MLSEKEIEKKLYLQADLFRHHMDRKDYLAAALCVDTAAAVAWFTGLDEDKKKELFGDREPDEPVAGLIPEERYLKACEWCIFKGRYARHRMSWCNIQKLAKKGG